MRGGMSEEDLRPFLQFAAGSKLGGVILALVCFGIASLGFLDPTAGLGIQLGLAIPFGAIGLTFLFLVVRPAGSHAFIVALRTRLPDVVWIYAATQTVNGQPAQTFVNIGLVDGKQQALGVGAETDPEPLLRLLAKYCPQAAVGHTPEHERQFKASPLGLRQA